MQYAQLIQVRRALTVTCRQPRNGSNTRKTLHTPAAGTRISLNLS